MNNNMKITTTGKSLKKLLDEWKFDYVNSDITENNFPIVTRYKKYAYKLYHFDRHISSEDAIKEIEKDGYEPANLYELLNWKDWNNKDIVVALGSVAKVRGFRGVSCLFRYDVRRSLDLGWWDYDWSFNYRFLAVRNLDSSKLEKELGISAPLSLESRISALEEFRTSF